MVERDSLDVITYNLANYVSKSMVDKNRTYKCICTFLYCKQDNHINKEVGARNAGGTQLFASGSIDQLIVNHQ